MATPSGRTNHTLIQKLQESPQRFGFFQAIRLLQLYYNQSADGGDSPRRAVGYDNPPDREIVRFRCLSSLSFPPNEIAAFDRLPVEDAENPVGPSEMTVSFMGLYGAAGVLPSHYTQSIIDESKNRRGAPMRDFFDLFNHRIISLFYRAWEKYRLPILFERAQSSSTQQRDAITECIYSVVGMAPNGTRNRQQIRDAVYLFYSGPFGSFPRNAMSLQRMLIDLFQLRFRIIQFQGEWLQLDVGQMSRLSPTGERFSTNNRLGLDSLAGSRVWSVEGLIRIRIGPVSYRRFTQLMPGTRLLTQISQFVRQYVGTVLESEYQIVLDRNDVPQLQMRESTADSPGPLLGRNTWLLSTKSAIDRDDAVFRCWGLPSR